MFKAGAVGEIQSLCTQRAGVIVVVGDNNLQDVCVIFLQVTRGKKTKFF